MNWQSLFVPFWQLAHLSFFGMSKSIHGCLCTGNVSASSGDEKKGRLSSSVSSAITFKQFSNLSMLLVIVVYMCKLMVISIVSNRSRDIACTKKRWQTDGRTDLATPQTYRSQSEGLIIPWLSDFEMWRGQSSWKSAYLKYMTLDWSKYMDILDSRSILKYSLIKRSKQQKNFKSSIQS